MSSRTNCSTPTEANRNSSLGMRHSAASFLAVSTRSPTVGWLSVTASLSPTQ
jgi:hypothetical protein